MEFFDTNVLVYAVDPRDPVRQARAREVLRESLDAGSSVISTQVMIEFRSAMQKQKLLTGEEAVVALRGFAGSHVLPTTADSLWRAFELQERYGFSIWDAAIVQSALDARCEVLYTEDLQHGQRIDELEIVNPFRARRVHEPKAVYAATRKRAR
jgi:predicted nucleic acid-binding protein